MYLSVAAHLLQAYNRTTRLEPGGEVRLGGRTRSRPVRRSGYGRLEILEPNGAWNGVKFGELCAGCQTTAVDPSDLRFGAFGLDCVTCHGAVDLNHSTGAEGRPYPNLYLPGADLFADWQVDPAKADDGHVFRSAREETSCLGCHEVHKRSPARHRRAAPGAVCQDCHYEGRPRSEVRARKEHNLTCEY